MRSTFDSRFQLARAGSVLALASLLFQLAMPASAADESPQQRRGGRGGGPERGVYKARISPNWFQDNTRFWYRNDLRGGTKEFIVIDTQAGTRQPAFDHTK